MDEQEDEEPEDESLAAERVESERKIQSAQAHLREWEIAGWQWKPEGGSSIERSLVHPSDPQVSVWFNPYTADIFLSPKLIQGIKEQLGKR